MIKKSYRICLLIILTISGLKSLAQNDESAVKAVINNLFEGMRKTDTALLRSTFTSQPILQTVARNREGKVSIRSENLDSFVVSIARPRKEVLDERISFETVRIDGDLAAAWTPYKFYIGDHFSHCGVNSFQLVKLDGVWKIQYLIDTRRRQGCD
jgi:hypothetical protein